MEFEVLIGEFWISEFLMQEIFGVYSGGSFYRDLV